jgi:hypothetical protein
MPIKDGQIEVYAMGGSDKKDQGTHEGKTDGSSTKPPSKPIEDDIEDGDFATPKRGIDGDDDEPL